MKTSINSSSISLSLILSFLIFTRPFSSIPDSTALLSFKSAANPSSPALSSWNITPDPCSGAWLGVFCRNGSVARVTLEGFGINGSLDPLTSLPLNLLSIKNNSFSSQLDRIDLSPWKPHLKLLYLSHNRFSGPFPVTIVLLRHLRRLDLAHNLLSGSLPLDLGIRLPRLLTLRLEGNFFTGIVPASLGTITGLHDFNISDNHLTGEIPSALSAVFQASAFAANQGLCGPSLAQKCASRATPKGTQVGAFSVESRTKKKKKRPWVVAAAAAILTVTLAAAALIALFTFYKRQGSKVEGNADGGKETERQEMVLFEGCKGLLLDELMRGSAEMLGRGAVGTTYRVVKEGGDMDGGVVVKRVRRTEKQAADLTEDRIIREIGRWRHRNVVNLRAYHSSKEEFLLVFDYLSNGSLHQLLHGNRGPGRTPVDWPTRLKLAQDAAEGLAFLHGTSKLSHGNLTSLNILLDDDGNARISDFALNRLLPLSSSSSDFNVIEIKTRSTRKITQKCDVYNFGEVLLEILTGRLTLGKGGETELARWVQTVAREERAWEVLDMELLVDKAMEDEMVALLQVAMLCIAPEARDRPRMSIVSKMIEDIRDRGSRRGRGSHSISLNDHFYHSSSPCLSEDSTPTLTIS